MEDSVRAVDVKKKNLLGEEKEGVPKESVPKEGVLKEGAPEEDVLEESAPG